jgi:hypothetical protein
MLSEFSVATAWRSEDTRGQVVNFLKEFRSRLRAVRVDSVGVGHNFALHLRDCGFPVELVNVGMPCESKPQLGENDPARRFVNLKACFYQALADAFERDLSRKMRPDPRFLSPGRRSIANFAGTACLLLPTARSP